MRLRGPAIEVVVLPENRSESAIRDWCVGYLANTLGLPCEEIDADTKFSRLGLDSANSVYLIVELEDRLGLELAPELIFEHPTVSDLARYLAERAAGDTQPE
jgi:acyl carrier protein